MQETTVNNSFKGYKDYAVLNDMKRDGVNKGLIRPSRFILNSAVLPGPGSYELVNISLQEAKQWLKDNPLAVSAIGYADTAYVMTELTGHNIIVDRRQAKLSEVGDEALVYRMVMNDDRYRLSIDQKKYGKDQLTRDQIKEFGQWCLLRRAK